MAVQDAPRYENKLSILATNQENNPKIYIIGFMKTNSKAKTTINFQKLTNTDSIL